jgi:hypothetical protein
MLLFAEWQAELQVVESIGQTVKRTVKTSEVMNLLTAKFELYAYQLEAIQYALRGHDSLSAGKLAQKAVLRRTLGGANMGGLSGSSFKLTLVRDYVSSGQEATHGPMSMSPIMSPIRRRVS